MGARAGRSVGKEVLDLSACLNTRDNDFTPVRSWVDLGTDTLKTLVSVRDREENVVTDHHMPHRGQCLWS